MKCRLWLIRHAPTHQKAAIGWTDVPGDLSDQARLDALRAQLPDAPIVSSDLIRASATADAVQGQRPRLPHEKDLRETHFGDWEGLSFSDIQSSDPKHARQYWSEPGDIAPPNGESWNVFSARSTGAIKRLVAANEAKDLIIVAHFGVILAALQMAGNLPTKSALAFQIDNLSLTRIDQLSVNGQCRIQSVNETS